MSLEIIGKIERLFRHFRPIFKIIGLKALGDYLDQFSSNKVSVLWFGGQKPNIFMISGFVDPWDPLFLDFNIPNDFKKYKKIMETFLKILFVYILESEILKVVGSLCIELF